jgi:uncharacterized protein (DUF2267 family)
MFNDNEIDKMLDGMSKKEMKAINKFFTDMLNMMTTEMIKENPDDISAKKAVLAARLMKVDTGEIAVLLTKLPDEEFSKHENNLKLALETFLQEQEALEKTIKGCD